MSYMRFVIVVTGAALCLSTPKAQAQQYLMASLGDSISAGFLASTSLQWYDSAGNSDAADADAISLRLPIADLAALMPTDGDPVPSPSDVTNALIFAQDGLLQDPVALLDVQIFSGTGTYTWNKPPAGKITRVIAIGPGGGGGSGPVVTSATATANGASGGSGGGGGAYTDVTFPTSALPSSLTVDIGAPGAAGAAKVASANTNGASGGLSAGTVNLHVGAASYLKAYGGGTGGGGLTTGVGTIGAGGAGSGGSGGRSTGSAGGAAGAVGGGPGNLGTGTLPQMVSPWAASGGVGSDPANGISASPDSPSTALGATGGGAGGSIQVGGAFQRGGGTGPTTSSPVRQTGGTTDGANGTAGVNATANSAAEGGGGGASSATVNGTAGSGGDGGFPGGGGGGGGAAVCDGSGGSATSGAGGKGGQGLVVMLTSF